MRNASPVEAQKPKIMLRELNHRRSDGIDVTLLWNVQTKGVFVSVAEQDGASFEFQVAAAEALDAFHHPYAYAPSRHRDTALAA